MESLFLADCSSGREPLQFTAARRGEQGSGRGKGEEGEGDGRGGGGEGL